MNDRPKRKAKEAAAAPPPAAPEKPARQLECSTDVIKDAIVQANALVSKWGIAQAIRAIQIAIKNAQPTVQPIDIADATRLRQIERRTPA